MSGPISTPPGAVRITIPIAIVWTLLGASFGFLWHQYLETHDALQRLQSDIATSKTLQDFKNDSFQRRLDQIDQELGRAPSP